MGYRTLDQVLVYDSLAGASPWYELDEECEFASLDGYGKLEIRKSNRINLPRIDADTHDWKELLKKALIEVILQRPITQTENLLTAWRHAYDGKDLDPYTWFSDKETSREICGDTHRNPNDRQHFTLDLPKGIVAITPDPETFGALSLGQDHDGTSGCLPTKISFFNFFFLTSQISVFNIKDFCIK